MARWAPPCGSPAWPWKKLEQRLPRWEYPAPPAPAGQGAPWQELQGAVSSQVVSFLSVSAPDRVTFIAKSLGTMALAGLPDEVRLPASGHHNVRRTALYRGTSGQLRIGL